ncbi:MAG TPA: N-acetyltransferase family protein, partial [Dermatophilaceae bacterium]|nr:N-acetyltransferase family protein [Dermatophilaceae bacterium]
RNEQPWKPPFTPFLLQTRSIDWLVATTPDDGIVGFAYAAKHRERAAYRWACDTSVYLAPVAQGHGLGRALYAALIERLAARGYRMLCAGVALPNDASVGLHRAVGFVDVGTYRAIGFKDGRWVDTLWLQRPLGGDGPPTREPG